MTKPGLARASPLGLLRAKQLFERAQKLEAGGARLLARGLDPRRDPRERAQVALARERGPRTPRAQKQVERDRGLAREQPEQVHLRKRERLLARAVEHLEHAERAILDEERHRHQ